MLCRKLKDEKSEEKLELVQAARTVRQMAKNLIDEMHEEVDTKIKTLAWNSHARQTRALEACARLKREFDESIHQHTGVCKCQSKMMVIFETIEWFLFRRKRI